jgi:hypothetical protein
MAWRIPYINEKLLKRRYLKWLHRPLGHLKHKLWPKEGSRVRLAVWFSTIKSRESTRFPCVQMACNISLESSQRGLQLFFRGLHAKLWCPKVARVPTLAISGLPLGSPRTKSHLDVGLVERCRIYYKGEGDGFPQVRAVVSLMCPCYPWLVLAPKVFQLCINHLVLVLCRSVWVNEACQLFLVPSRNSSMPLYPSKVLRARERALTPCSSAIFCLGLTFESFKELGVHHKGISYLEV